MTDLPDPLTPPDCDLRGNEWMPLYGDRLFASDTWLMASPEGRCAALTLWWAGWKQSPAASLPDNDRALAQLAGYGMQVAGWLKVKEEAMRCWIKCSDGRLYHPVLAEFAVAAWGRREHAKRRKADYRARQAGDTGGDNNGTSHNVPVPVPVLERVRNGDERRGEEKRGEERKEERKKESPPTPRKRGEVIAHPDFEEFWEAYPRKVGKGSARKAWFKALAKTAPEVILRAVQTQRWSAEERYQPHASTWLNAERWLDQADTFDPVLRAAGLTPADMELLHDDEPDQFPAIEGPLH